MPKLTHYELLKFGQLLGYKLIDIGLCQGFSCMLMQATLSQDEDRFWARLQLIERYKDNFSSLKNEIEQVKLKVKNKKKLSEEEIELIEIPAFYEGVELYLNVNAHWDVFNGQFIHQWNIGEIYTHVKSIQLEKSDISIVLNKNYFFNKATLTNYLQDLAEVINTTPKIPILLNNHGHIVYLTYNVKNSESPWIYVDTNDFDRFPEIPNYFRELTQEELVNSLYISLGDNWGYLDYSKFGITMIADSSHYINEHVAIFEKLLVRKDKHIDINKVNEDGATSLYMACQNRNGPLVVQLLTLNGIDINKSNKDGATPLYNARENNELALVELLLEQKDIEINKAHHDGTTPLDIACLNGHMGVVHALLESKMADVNKIDLQKNTPLLIACLSLQTQGKKPLFRMLLEHKASLMHKNNNGYTALDIAFLRKNNSAIEEMFSHIKTSKLSLVALMSSNTRNEAMKWAISNSDSDLLTNLVRNKLFELSRNRFLNSNTIDYSAWDLKTLVEQGISGADTNSRTICVELGWLTKEGLQVTIPEFIINNEAKQEQSLIFCDF